MKHKKIFLQVKSCVAMHFFGLLAVCSWIVGFSKKNSRKIVPYFHFYAEYIHIGYLLSLQRLRIQHRLRITFTRVKEKQMN